MKKFQRIGFFKILSNHDFEKNFKNPTLIIKKNFLALCGFVAVCAIGECVTEAYVTYMVSKMFELIQCVCVGV